MKSKIILGTKWKNQKYSSTMQNFPKNKITLGREEDNFINLRLRVRSIQLIVPELIGTYLN